MAKDYSKLGEYEERFGMEFALAFYDALQQCQHPENLDYIFRQYNYELERLNRALRYFQENDTRKVDFVNKFAEAIRLGKPLSEPNLPRSAEEYVQRAQEYGTGEYGDPFKKSMQAIESIGLSAAEVNVAKRKLIDEWPERINIHKLLVESRSGDLTRDLYRSSHG